MSHHSDVTTPILEQRYQEYVSDYGDLPTYSRNENQGQNDNRGIMARLRDRLGSSDDGAEPGSSGAGAEPGSSDAGVDRRAGWEARIRADPGWGEVMPERDRPTFFGSMADMDDNEDNRRIFYGLDTPNLVERWRKVYDNYNIGHRLLQSIMSEMNIESARTFLARTGATHTREAISYIYSHDTFNKILSKSYALFGWSGAPESRGLYDREGNPIYIDLLDVSEHKVQLPGNPFTGIGIDNALPIKIRYEILGLSKNATIDDINARFSELSLSNNSGNTVIRDTVNSLEQNLISPQQIDDAPGPQIDDAPGPGRGQRRARIFNLLRGRRRVNPMTCTP